jgi:peptide/nickel transport system substrate-binding protein
MDDVAFTIGSLQDDTFATPVASVWSDVDMQVKDDHVVTFQLPRPFPDFKQALTVGLLPAHAWRDIPAANVKLTTLNTKPIGCGPFAFSKLTRDSRGVVRTLTLHRHEGYHGAKPYLDDVVFKFYPDYDTAVAALLNGNIQGLGSLPASAVKAASERRNLVLHQLTIPQYTAAFFNLRSSDVLKRPEVRQALALAADRQAILDQSLAGQGQIIDGPVLPVPSNIAAANGKPDLDAARKVLSDAGWKQVDGTWQKDKVTLSVKLLAADRPEHKAITDVLKQSWEALGIPTAVELVDRPSLRDRVRNGNFEAVIFSESLGATGNPFAFWHSSQAGVGGLNISAWSNRDADSLLEQIRAAADPAQRQDLLIKFQGLIHASQPALFLYSPTYTYPVSASVRGIQADRLGTPSDRFSGVASWYVKTKRSL